MGGAVAITRVDLTAAQLRAAAGREKDGSAARRMLALAMVLDGADRKSAAETCGMDRQTLRDWVHRYNAEGLRGLHDVKTPGPKPKLTAEQQIELARLVEAGPDPACHGVVRWRRTARTLGWQAAGKARLPPALRASAPSTGRRRGPGGV
jgi:transposase